MIPEDLPPMQPPQPALAPGACPPIPDEPRCPWCGAPLPPLPLQASGLIDYVLLAEAVLSDLKSALEEGVVP